jgi:hypothetical protein
MTNLVLTALLAMSPADFAQLTNRVDVLWTAHTQRVERIERARENARRRREGPPDRPFRAKGGRR